MSKNMTNLDRGLRAFLAAPVALAVGILVGPASVGSIVLYALAAVMLATARSATARCIRPRVWAAAAAERWRSEARITERNDL